VIDEKTYSLAEIEEQTGFDRRTISYYVQQGLLPKVGRRGPKTRYSQVFFNRLALIRMIRELQDRGAMGSMTLSDIRDLFQSAPDKLIADVVNGKETLDGIDDRFQAKSAPRGSEGRRPTARFRQGPKRWGCRWTRQRNPPRTSKPRRRLQRGRISRCPLHRRRPKSERPHPASTTA
jgi:DNA-binding transcriptional MerR regulator